MRYLKITFIFLLFYLAFGISSLYAQDYLYKKNGEKLEVKVVQNDGNFIKYRLYQTRDTKIYSVPLNQVYMIDYEGIGIEHIKDNNVQNNNQQQYQQQPQQHQQPVQNQNTLNDQNNNTNNYTDTQSSDTKTTNDSYFGAGIGYGNSYGGGGIKLQYVFDKNIKIGIHAGVGLYADALDADANIVLGYSIGAQYYIWKGLYIDAQYGGFGIYNKAEVDDNSNDVYFNTELLVGPAIILGYDWFLTKNIGINIGAGTCYDINAGNDFYYAFDMGILFRF